MRLSIVVPCYNEEEVLPETAERLRALLNGLIERGRVAQGSAIVFVDDGSSDATWPLILELTKEHAEIEGIRLSRNRGHQNALLAGLLSVEGDALISIDADLQDDPEVIEEMVDRHLEGYDIVYGVRRRRAKDAFFKRSTARLFYRLLRFGNRDMIDDHADFRLMSRRAVEGLRGFREINLFLRGLVTLIGFPTTTVFYDRAERRLGTTKYPLGKMLGFAFDGISSFTALPLRAITVIGFLTFLACIALVLWALILRFFTDRAIPGWTSTVLPIYTIGAIQILCVGVLGEYLAKIYSEVKGRPRYIIEASTIGLGHGSKPPESTTRGSEDG